MTENTSLKGPGGWFLCSVSDQRLGEGKKCVPETKEVLLLKQNLPTTALLRPLMVVSVGQLSYPSVFSSYEKILPSLLRELAWIPGIALHIIVFYGFKLPHHHHHQDSFPELFPHQQPLSTAVSE